MDWELSLRWADLRCDKRYLKRDPGALGSHLAWADLHRLALDDIDALQRRLGAVELTAYLGFRRAVLVAIVHATLPHADAVVAGPTLVSPCRVREGGDSGSRKKGRD